MLRVVAFWHLGLMTTLNRAFVTVRTPSLRRTPSQLVAVSMSTTNAQDRRSNTRGIESLKKWRALADDAVRVALETGPRAAVRRTLEGQRAVLETSLELANELPSPPSPQTLLQLASSKEGLARGLVAWARENVPEELAPKFVRLLFERLGATYVKVGQFVASSPTLFPAAYVREFQKCLDQTPAVSFEAIKAIVEADLGRPISAVFESFDREPLASASIAQVHAAKYCGRDVVVKVRKPGVDELLKADLGFIEIAGKALETIAPELGRLSLADFVSDLRATMIDELDFSKELRNLEVFAVWLEEMGLASVATCPRPYKEASGLCTLTMDRLYGSPVTDLDALRALNAVGPDGRPVDPETILVNALNTWTASVLTCDFFHADVHAGNLIALPDGRVGFLDFGIVGRVPARIWNEVAAAADAAARADYRSLARALRDMGASERDVDIDKFALDLRSCFDALGAVQPTVIVERDALTDQVAAQLALDDAQVADVLISFVRTAENNGIKLPREFGLLVKQSLYFDRYTKLLAPELDVLQDDRLSYLRDATDRSYTDPTTSRTSPVLE